MAQNGEVIPEPARQLRELIQALRSQHCDHLLRSLNHSLNAPGISVEEQTELLQQKERIRQIATLPLWGVI